MEIKEINTEINQDIIDLSLDVMNLVRKMDKEENIKQAIFFISISDDNGTARIAPVACGHIKVLATIIAQYAMQDNSIKTMMELVNDMIKENKPLPIIAKNYLKNK